MAKLPVSVRVVTTSPATTVATLLATASLRRDIHVLLSPHVRLVHCDDAHALVEVARARQIAVALVSLRDASGQPISPRLGALRNAAPRLRIVGVLDCNSGNSSDVAPAVRAGMHALIVLELGDAWQVVREHIGASGLGEVRALVDSLAPHVNHDALRLIEALSDQIVTDGSAAPPHATIQSPPRTTSRRFARAGLPSPALTRRWLELIIAADHLRHRTMTVERAAFDAGFASITTFRRTLARLAGLRPLELRVGGGFEALIERFAAACAEARHDGGRKTVATATLARSA